MSQMEILVPFRYCWILIFGFWLFQPSSLVLGQEVVKLSSGRDVTLVEGKLRAESAQELYLEAERLLQERRLEWAMENCELIAEKGSEPWVPKALSLMDWIKAVEYSSHIILKNGELLRGKFLTKLRSDSLGLASQQEMPVWELEKIEVDYSIETSKVSNVQYLLTTINTKLIDSPAQVGTITSEVELLIQTQEGLVKKAILGHNYQLLSGENLDEKVANMIGDRVEKVIIYPLLVEKQSKHP